MANDIKWLFHKGKMLRESFKRLGEPAAFKVKNCQKEQPVKALYTASDSGVSRNFSVAPFVFQKDGK
jgi:hypothetical protein